MMNPAITTKIMLNTFQRNFCRYLSTQKYIKYCNNQFHNTNENRTSPIVFSRNLSRKSLCRAAMPLCTNFQKRNLVTEPTGFIPSQAREGFVIPGILKYVHDWEVVQIAQKTLLHVHETTGLPWWATIVVTTLLTRTAIALPVSILQMRNTARLELVRMDMVEHSTKLRMQTEHLVVNEGLPLNLANQTFKREMNNFYLKSIQRDNCHPGRSIVLLIMQLPVWFFFSIATRNLCYMLPNRDEAARLTFMELMDGGFGWVINLTAPDPQTILPILIGVFSLVGVEVNQLFHLGKISRIYKWIINFYRGFSVFFMCISSFLPAAVNIYWLTCITFGLVLTFTIRSPTLKRLFRIRMPSYETQHPYLVFYAKLRAKLGL